MDRGEKPIELEIAGPPQNSFRASLNLVYRGRALNTVGVLDITESYQTANT